MPTSVLTSCAACSISANAPASLVDRRRASAALGAADDAEIGRVQRLHLLRGGEHRRRNPTLTYVWTRLCFISHRQASHNIASEGLDHWLPHGTQESFAMLIGLSNERTA